MWVVSINHSAILISQLLLLWDEPSSILSFQISPLSTLSSCRRFSDGSVHHQRRSDGCGCRHLRQYKPSTSSRRRQRSSLHLTSSNEYNNNDTDKSSIKKGSKRSNVSYSKSHTKAHETKPRRTISTMSTALCIVPPDDAWDTIQRARHLARDTSFYKWPPAIRLFHPFAPKNEIPGLVGMLADWIDDQNDEYEMGVDVGVNNIFGDDQEDDDIVGTSELQDLINKSTQKIMTTQEEIEDPTTIKQQQQQQQQPSNNNSKEILSTFEITLDSILILPHFEILDARIAALDNSHYIPKQAHLRDSIEETEYQKRKAQGLALIEEEERKGLLRKKERERKKRKKKKKNGGKKKNESEMIMSAEEEEDEDESSSSDEATPSTSSKESKNSYNGPCVIYLSPNDESRIKLETLRERLRRDLFSNYDGFSPSSSVSPYPECLPRKVKVGGNNQSTETTVASQFRPLLPVARFPTVQDAIKIAKVLQQTWDPLTFNVTDIQFVSREDDMDMVSQHAPSPELNSGIGFGGSRKESEDLNSIPEVRHRKKHGTLSSSTTDNAHKRMGLTTSGEVEDVSQQGIYRCDAMVMLLGEEPEESLMDEEASLSMIMDDNDDEDNGDDGSNEKDNDDNINGRINYNEIFATAEREYQRMQAHEELSTARYVGDVPIFDSSVTDIEAWLDGDDDESEDEGATVVIGRAQFFMGAMREFIG